MFMKFLRGRCIALVDFKVHNKSSLQLVHVNKFCKGVHKAISKKKKEKCRPFLKLFKLLFRFTLEIERMLV